MKYFEIPKMKRHFHGVVHVYRSMSRKSMGSMVGEVARFQVLTAAV
jgi:hypothetical protein